MRVASFNIRGGRDDDGHADPAALAAAVAGLGADVVALQEVDRGVARSGRVDQVALAAGVLGLAGADHVRGAAALRFADGGSYGIALLSRHRVAQWRRVELPRWPLPVPLLPRPRWGRVRRVERVADEPRVGLAAVLDRDDLGVRTVVTAHLSFLPGVNLVQLRRLLRRVADLPGPVLVIGDLNVGGALPPLLLGRGGGHGRWRALDGPATFPAAAPRQRLDRALVTPASALGSLVLSAPVAGRSDHRPLVCET